MSIIVTSGGRHAQKVDKSTFEEEDHLQEYIFANPESLPLYEIKDDIQLLILAREFETDSGPIDAIGVDKDGEIYVIETKLYKNPDKRLVVAQVLDYGAALWRNSDRVSFLSAAEASVKEAFGCDLRTKLQGFFGITVDAAATLIEEVARNLQAGNFKFVVLMDRLHDRLKDLVVFLNASTRFSIYAVEIEYYKFDKYEIVIPKLFGSEVKKEVASPSGSARRRTWDEASFFQDAERNLSPTDLAGVRRLYEYAQERASEITWGTGQVSGSFNPKFRTTGVKSPFTVYSEGSITLNFHYIDESAGSFRDQWCKALARALRLAVTPETNFKTIEFQEWGPQVEQFISLFDDLLRLQEKE